MEHTGALPLPRAWRNVTSKQDAEDTQRLPAIDRGHTYPMPLWLQLIRWFRSILLVSIATNAAVLVLTVILGLALTETDAVPLPWQLVDAIDEFSRLFLGVASLIGLFGFAIIFAVVHDVYWACLRWHLGRFTEDVGNRRQVPVDWQRASYGPDADGTSLLVLYPGTFILSLFGYVLGPIVALTSVIMIVQDDDVEFSLVVLLVGVLFVLVPLGVRRVLKRVPESKAKAFWGDAKAGQFQPRSKQGDCSPALARLVAMSAKTERVAGVLATIAALSFLPTAIATFITQPCRGCEPRDLSDLGQSLVGFLAGAAGWIAVLTLIPMLVAFVVGAVLRYRLRQQLLTDAAGEGTNMPPWPVLNWVLLEEAPLIRFFALSHVVGLFLFEIGIAGLLFENSALQIDDGVWWALFRAGAGLIAFGGVFWWFGRGRVAEERELLMNRWGGQGN